MPKLRVIIKPPPEPSGDAEQQVEALRDYLLQVSEELAYVLTHLEADNINDTTFERIQGMIPRAYTGLPPMDGQASSGQAEAWARGDHRHPSDEAKVDKTQKVNGHALSGDVTVTKGDVGLSNVANERQYSAQNPPPIPTPGDVGAVPETRRVNGYALSADIDLTASDVGARPDTWTPSAADVGAVDANDVGAAGGVAELDIGGRVPSSQLPSYVDDVLEYPTYGDFPVTGETGKIYVAEDTNITYRWSGSGYVEISASLALGETSSTAYRGDRGKIAYDHSQAPATSDPLMDGTAAPGSSARWSPEDHVHPTDTTRAAVSLEINGHALTGDFDLDAEDIEYDNGDSVKDKLDEIDGMLPDTILGPPAADGTYVLQCVVDDGEFEYRWVTAS